MPWTYPTSIMNIPIPVQYVLSGNATAHISHPRRSTVQRSSVLYTDHTVQQEQEHVHTRCVGAISFVLSGSRMPMRLSKERSRVQSPAPRRGRTENLMKTQHVKTQLRIRRCCTRVCARAAALPIARFRGGGRRSVGPAFFFPPADAA